GGGGGEAGDAAAHVPGADDAEAGDTVEGTPDGSGHGRGREAYTISTASAMPSPPPMHSDATPRRLPASRSADSSGTSTRAPDAPIGWPSATAPPQTLTRAGSSPSNLLLAIDTTANASLISHRSTSSFFQPARPSTFSIAPAGAVVNHSGAWA